MSRASNGCLDHIGQLGVTQASCHWTTEEVLDQESNLGFLLLSALPLSYARTFRSIAAGLEPASLKVVGGEGLEPPKSEDVWFTARCRCRLAIRPSFFRSVKREGRSPFGNLPSARLPTMLLW